VLIFALLAEIYERSGAETAPQLSANLLPIPQLDLVHSLGLKGKRPQTFSKKILYEIDDRFLKENIRYRLQKQPRTPMIQTSISKSRKAIPLR
jgi:hypothetical protein